MSYPRWQIKNTKVQCSWKLVRTSRSQTVVTSLRVICLSSSRPPLRSGQDFHQPVPAGPYALL